MIYPNSKRFLPIYIQSQPGPGPGPEPDYSTMPLTFKSYGNTNIFLKTNGSNAPTKTFYYSLNGGPWTLYINNRGGRYTGSTINLSDGDTIAFSGTPNNLSLQTQNDRS